MKSDNLSPDGDSSSRFASIEKNRRLLVCLLLSVSFLLVAFAIFRRFLFGGAVLLYKDIGSDSINVFFPYLVHLSDYIRSEGLPSWSFCVGMGQSLSYFMGYLFWQPVVWLPRELISHALVFQHLIKVSFAGLLFFRFLQLRGLNLSAAFLGSFLLSFSAYMCMGSCWYVQADEVVGFTAVLFAAEQGVTRGRWLYLVLAVAVIGFLSAFHLYLCALLLLFYVPVRLSKRYSWPPLPLLRTSLLLAAAATLGVGIAAVVVLPNFDGLLNSPRGRGPTSLVGELSSAPVFGLQSRLYYVTACLRTFGNDLLGVGSDFRGWRNYLEAPANYCGLLCLVIVPQVFVGVTWRRRIIYALFLAGILIPIVFPWFRYLFWLFQGDYFRALSLFSILGIITLSVTAFSRYTDGGGLSLSLLAVTIIVLIGILYLPLSEFQTLVSALLRRVCTVILVFYAVALAIGQLLRRQKIAGAIIVAATALELIYFGRMTVEDRPVITKQDLTARIGYNDQTVDAVRDIKTADEGFYRIFKAWPSGLSNNASLNDAMVFGFFGTASYSSFNNLNYINFLLALDVISARGSDVEIRWSKGLLRHPFLSTFACEKYALVKDSSLSQEPNRFEFVRCYDNVCLFRNKLFLPLGLTYSHYITENVFLQLSPDEKARALLHAVVLSDENAAARQGLSQLELRDLKQQLMETPIPDLIAARQAKALQIHSFRQTRIEGAVRLDEKSVMVLQTPFDRGWRAFQDDRVAPVLKVDVGLLGVLLDGGEHNVKLRYHPPFVREGAILTMVSILVFALALWRWPRIRTPRGSDVGAR